jgi:MFS family permease
MNAARTDDIPAPIDRRRSFMRILRVASGNFLEMYDFQVFGYYAVAIGRAYFPSGNEITSLLLVLMTFGAGFLMRPFGAIVLGSYIDRHGRRAGLLLTLALMSVGTLSIAVTPDYATIGLAAPIIVLLGRLLQGFSAGAELGGVSVYLAEIATPGRKGFYVSWQSASQQVAVAFAALLGFALGAWLLPKQMDAFGWRIPMLVGCAIIPVLFYLRNSLEETEAFKSRPRTPTMRELLASLVKNAGIVTLGVMLVIMTTVSFYLITAYTPTFGRQVLKLGSQAALLITVFIGLSNLFWLPVMGALSDRIGRRPILIFFTVLALVTVYPAMLWLVSAPSFGRLLAVELWLSFIYGSYNGAMVVYLTEIMPAAVRSSGFSLAYSLATVVGGFTPAIVTWLIATTGNRAVPGLWMSAAAAIALVATVILARQASGAARAATVGAGRPA